MTDASTLIKAAAYLKSFVVEEVAATHLLVLSWKPIARKIMVDLEKVVDFQHGSGLFPDKTMDPLLWHSRELHDLVDQQWEAAKPGIDKYLRKSWQKGVTAQLLKADDPNKESIITTLLDSLASFYKQHIWAHVQPAVEKLMAWMRKLQESPKVGPVHDPGVAVTTAHDESQVVQFVPESVANPGIELKDLADAIEVVVTSEDYMATLGNLYVARSHHFGMLEYLEKEGIKFYKISAVLDDKTCNTCIQLDGKVIPLIMGQKARDLFLKNANDLDALKSFLPFTRYNDVKDLEDGDIAGRVDLALPPRHPACRCILVPVREG